MSSPLLYFRKSFATGGPIPISPAKVVVRTTNPTVTIDTTVTPFPASAIVRTTAPTVSIDPNTDVVELATGHPNEKPAVVPNYSWDGGATFAADGRAVADGGGITIADSTTLTLSRVVALSEVGNHRFQFAAHVPSGGTLTAVVKRDTTTIQTENFAGPLTPSDATDWTVTLTSFFAGNGDDIDVELSYSGTSTVLLDTSRVTIQAAAPLVARDESFTPATAQTQTYDILANDDFTPSATIQLSDSGFGSNVNTPTFDGTTGEMTYRPHGSEFGQVVTIEYNVTDTAVGQTDSAIVTLTIPTPTIATIARPDAEGFGRATMGARKNYQASNKPTVYVVSNTNDSGAGSFRQAFEATGNRVIIFSISGTLDVLSRMRTDGDNLTILGQTAPGDGFQIRNGDHSNRSFWLRNNEAIVSFMKIRPGAPPKHVSGTHTVEFIAPNVMEFPGGIPSGFVVGDRIKIFGSAGNDRGSSFSSFETNTEYAGVSGTNRISVNLNGDTAFTNSPGAVAETGVTVIASQDKGINSALYSNGFGLGQLTQHYYNNCSVQFQTDEGIGITRVTNWTVKDCLMGWPIAGSAPGSDRGKNFLTGLVKNCGPGTLYRSVCIGSSDRNPRFSNEDKNTIEILNVISAGNERFLDMSDNEPGAGTSEGPICNIVSCDFRDDHGNSLVPRPISVLNAGGDTTFYVANCKSSDRTLDTQPETDVVHQSNGSLNSVVGTPHPTSEIVYSSLHDPFASDMWINSLKATAGAYIPTRDELDAKYVTELEGGAVPIITSETDLGLLTADSRGFPTMTPASIGTDSNGDGIPDSYDMNGLQANDIGASGYLVVEEYAFTQEGIDPQTIPTPSQWNV